MRCGRKEQEKEDLTGISGSGNLTTSLMVRLLSHPTHNFRLSFCFIFREKYKGKGRKKRGRKMLMCERNIHQLPLSCPQLGTWLATQACTLDWESNWWPFGSQIGIQSTEPHQPGPTHNFNAGDCVPSFGNTEIKKRCSWPSRSSLSNERDNVESCNYNTSWEVLMAEWKSAIWSTQKWRACKHRQICL